jgi:hypothetical protein
MVGCRWTLKGQIMQDFLSSEKHEDKRLLWDLVMCCTFPSIGGITLSQ